MSSYRVEWKCCGDITITEGYEPQSCPFCELRKSKEHLPVVAVFSNVIVSTVHTPTASLRVWFGPMPESNGKTNWTAILHRGMITKGITIDRSEYKDRVRYEADRMRWMIGELPEEPDIMKYDHTLHSGYRPNEIF